MNNRFIYTSLTRITNLSNEDFKVKPLPKIKWANGDYIAVEITDSGSGTQIELPDGRMMDALTGEKAIGALGVRHATLEATGTWAAARPDEEMHLLTGAGLCGKMTSLSAFSPRPIRVKYLGHVMVDGEKYTMSKAVKPVPEASPYITPTIVMVGTSMSAGKTTTGRIVTHELKKMGLRVVAVKMTGAGRYRDILALKDAGADVILDFVDVGLPSSICPKGQYHRALNQLLTRMAMADADVAVVEIGASPLEPYNGDEAILRIKDHIKCRILCASDPYAVYGVMKGFGFTPDLVSGPATNTIAGVELVEKLCGVNAVNLINPDNLPILKHLLKEKLGVENRIEV